MLVDIGNASPQVRAKMLSGAITPGGRAVVVEREAPRAHGDLVLVRVDVTPMCTEFRLLKDGQRHDELGHEAVGVVIDAADSTRVARGDRVVVMPGFACGHCRLCARGEYIFCDDQRDVLQESGSEAGTGTYAQYLLKPDYLLFPIPDDVSSDHAAAAVCLLGPGFNALNAMNVRPGESLLVGGCGPVGLGAIIVGVTLGARVLAIEGSPYRRALATALGAEAFDPSTDGVTHSIRSMSRFGVNAALETRPSTQLVPLVERLGRLAIVTWGAELTFPPLVPLGLTIHGCWHWNHERDGEGMWDLVRRARSLIDCVVTHRFAMSEVAKAMDVQKSRQCGKVLLYPHGRLVD